MAIRIVKSKDVLTAAFAIGSVQDTLAGHIDPSLANKRFHASDYSFGFEAASPEDVHSIGEAILLNNLCFTASTMTHKVIYGESFVTGGIFLLSKGATPSHNLTCTSPTSLEELLQTIYKEIQRPLVFTGLCECSVLNSTAIAKAPIDDLAIFEHKEIYYPQPPQVLVNKTCFFMGIITSYSDKCFESLNKQLEVVLYKNPLDREYALSSHTHCLTLNTKPTSIEAITPESATACLHVFTDKTILNNATFNLYTLESINSKTPT